MLVPCFQIALLRGSFEQGSRDDLFPVVCFSVSLGKSFKSVKTTRTSFENERPLPRGGGGGGGDSHMEQTGMLHLGVAKAFCDP